MAILELETANSGTDLSGRGQRKVWDTKQVCKRESFSYYREGLCQALFALTPEVGDQNDFEGRIEQFSTSSGAINYLEHVPHSVRRSARDTHGIGERYLHLNYQISGTNQYDIDGSVVARQPGSLIAFQSTCPFSLHMDEVGTNSLVSLLIPETDLTIPLLDKGLAAINPIYDTPMKTLFSTLVHQLDGGCAEEFEQIYGAIVALLNASLASDVEQVQASENCASLDLVKAFVRLNLGEACLTPERIAQSFGMSRRYLDKLFAQSGETCAQFVRRSRVARAHIDILDPGQTQFTVTEIAMRWGFSDLSTFNRAYAKHYGCSASKTRKRC